MQIQIHTKEQLYTALKPQISVWQNAFRLAPKPLPNGKIEILLLIKPQDQGHYTTA